MRPKGWNKYRAKKTVFDGITFASKAEADRYWELKLLRAAGEITELVLQPKFALIVNGEKIGRYTPDFSYFERKPFRQIVEETKGYKTEAYALRVKLFQALFPNIELRVNGVPAKRPKTQKIKRAA